MWLELASLAIILGNMAYHRWFEDKPKPKPEREFQIPRVDEGATIPLLYGLCRVRAPILAFIGTPDARLLKELAPSFGAAPDSMYLYGCDLMFVVGMPFDQGIAFLFNIFASDLRLQQRVGDLSNYGGPARHYVVLRSLDGQGNYERDYARGHVYSDSPGLAIGGEVELLNGKQTQDLVGPGPFYPTGLGAKTWTGQRMIGSGIVSLDMGGNIVNNTIPGYRSKTCVFLGRLPIEDGDDGDIHGSGFLGGLGDIDYFVNEIPDGFILGTTPQVPAFSFEMWAYATFPVYLQAPATSTGDGSLINSGDGFVEVNPIDVIYDLCTGKVGKLGIPPARIDKAGTWKTAAKQLVVEGHGYSRSIEEPQEARELIQDILKQIDAVMYEDPDDRLLKIKLVRGDYDPFTVPRLDVDNCRFSNYELIGWPNLVNKVRVVFNERKSLYNENSATSHNSANATGQDGQTRELVIKMDGVPTMPLALDIAEREMSARSRPIAKMRATTSKKFRHLRTGGVVTVTWKAPNGPGIDGVPFRIADMDFGSPEDDEIGLDLIQDIFYIRRGVVQQPVVSPFPGVLGNF